MGRKCAAHRLEREASCGDSELLWRHAGESVLILLLSCDQGRIELDKIELREDGGLEFLFHDGAARAAGICAFPWRSRFDEDSATTCEIDAVPAPSRPHHQGRTSVLSLAIRPNNPVEINASAIYELVKYIADEE